MKMCIFCLFILIMVPQIKYVVSSCNELTVGSDEHISRNAWRNFGDILFRIVKGMKHFEYQLIKANFADVIL